MAIGSKNCESRADDYQLVCSFEKPLIWKGLALKDLFQILRTVNILTSLEKIVC